MSSKRAKVISRDAFMKSFVEAEVIMRRNLAAQIEEAIKLETNPATIVGLKKAKEIVFGKVEDDNLG
jgi:alpha-D-ribose 1-methylphosphonate 5-triphosphate diphosphatase PhnM